MAETGMSNIQQRVAVGVAGVPLVIWISWMGGAYFFALMLLCSLLAINEFYRLLSVRVTPPSRSLFLFFSFCLQLNFFFVVVEPWILLLAILMTFLVLEMFRTEGSRIVNIGSSMTAIFYVNITFGSLMVIREREPSGFAYVLLLFVCIWSADILAYFGGRLFGGKLFKKKFFERLSPHKTWEGYISGCLGSVLGSAVVALLDPGLPTVFTLVAGLSIGLFSPLGDLVESMFKRDAGVKDSSSLIPGHGGVLDRFDTIMFMSPLLYLYIYFAEIWTGL